MRVLASVCFALSLCSCSESGPAVATNFTLDRFQGHWYEIARVPRDYDERCRDTVADYRLTGANSLEMRHSCWTGSGPQDIQNFRATATVDDAAVPAKLSLQIGAYSAGYWVLDVGQDYEYAVIGHPSRTMLWILSRTPELDSALYAKALTLATGRGFDVGQLQKTPQSEAIN